MNAASLRKGWCPGALRPMRTGDGWLVRVRAAGGRLDFDRAEAIADCAMRFGSGAIEISSRANLQLRGIGDDDLPRLQQRLAKAGLLDNDVDSESVRNIVASPLADFDPAAVLDTAPVVAALEARLAQDAALHPLPAKFCFIVDGGGALPLGDVEADIRFEALAQGEAPRFAVSLGEDRTAALCVPAEAADAAAALARVFLEKRGDGEDASRRMRELVARLGVAAIFRAAGLDLASAPRPARRRAAPRDYLGIHQFGETYCVGAAPALGRLTGEDLAYVAREARRLSGAGLRLTPWRALLLPGLDVSGAQAMSAALALRGFVLDPADPRLSVVACSGAPKCANAARAVQIEALQLAPLLPGGGGIVLHVSGCEKGCAHGRAAPLTLVARPGGYDLVVGGKASDKPFRRGLTIGEAASFLAQTYGSAG
jgi:precorrin-3B synthase